MKNESASQNLTSKAGEPGSPAQDNETRQEIARLTTLLFQEIQIDQFFEFRGRRYQKLALSMASDEDRNGNIFQAETEVLADLVASPADRVGLRTATALVNTVDYPAGSRKVCNNSRDLLMVMVNA
jgi:hypothetical protein